MKLPTKTLLTLVLGLSSAATYGTTFDYSYAFVGTYANAGGNLSGHVITGSLDGDLNGNFVDNVANVSVFFDGTAMTGTAFSGGYNQITGWSGPAIVSFDAALNNFGFFNSDNFNGIYNYTAYFYMIKGSVSQAEAYNRSINLYVGDYPVSAANWSVTARTSGSQPVPDGGNMAMMLGGGLVCLAVAGRRKPTPLNESKDQASLS